MVRIIVEVDAPSWAVQGIKEHLAMVLENFGDTQIVSVDGAECRFARVATSAHARKTLPSEGARD